MKRTYAPTEEEYEKIIKQAEQEPIDCPICHTRLLVYWERKKPKRKIFTDCNQHIILSDAVTSIIQN